MNIRFIDYRRSFGGHRAFVARAIATIAISGEFILKSNVRELEHAICQVTGARHAASTASATGAMLLALKAMGVGPGVEVLIPAFGFPSPVSCVLSLGGRPVLIDVQAESGVLNAELLEGKITSRTRVIIPMHLGRSLADMVAITNLARAYNIAVLEDSAVALGANIDGVAAGRWGNAGVFSFFPSKPLGGIGDSGMLITDDPSLAARCRRLRNHGQEEGRRFLYEEVGWNNRMDEISAAFLLMKLETFRVSLNRRTEIATYYDEAFAVLKGRLTPLVNSGADFGHHKYAVCVKDPEPLRTHLQHSGIETQLFYAPALHLHPGFATLGYGVGDFPVAERLAVSTLALPCYPEMTNEEVEYVAQKVDEFYAK